jgi:hypothetical protein
MWPSSCLYQGHGFRSPLSKKAPAEAPVTARAPRAGEIKFQYPGPDVVSEVSCYSEPRPSGRWRAPLA